MRLLRPLLERISLHFHKHDGSLLKSVQARVGASILDAAHANNIDIEGACGGQCACATCHVYIPENLYAKHPASATDEQDMLDLAQDLRSNSRLGCQVKLTKEFHESKVVLPACVVNQLS